MPWGNMAVIDNGDTATLFVSNAGFGVGSPDGDPPRRQQGDGRCASSSSIPDRQAARGRRARPSSPSGFGAQADKDVFLIGPTGLALGANGTLYVSDAIGNRIVAIRDAATTRTTAPASAAP